MPTPNPFSCARIFWNARAQKGGRNVSQWIVLQYDFNIYEGLGIGDWGLGKRGRGNANP